MVYAAYAAYVLPRKPDLPAWSTDLLPFPYTLDRDLSTLIEPVDQQHLSTLRSLANRCPSGPFRVAVPAGLTAVCSAARATSDNLWHVGA